MAETIFAKILRGDIPCHRLYEDDHVLSFLDVNPLSRGHSLVIPREPAATLDQLSDEASAAIGRVMPRICRAILAATGASAFNVLQNNGRAAHQVVFHVHYHIIPKFDRRSGSIGGGDPTGSAGGAGDNVPRGIDDGAGLGLEWKTSPLVNGPELAALIAAKL